MPNEATDFSAYRLLLLKEIERLDATQKSLDATIATIGKVLVRIETTLTSMDKRDADREESARVLTLRTDVVERDLAAIKTKVSVFGAGAGLGAAGLTQLLQALL